MQRTRIKTLYRARPDDYADQRITVAGWARSVRASNVFGFIELNDGSFFGNLQIVFEKDKLVNYDAIAALGAGAGLVVEGVFTPTPDAKQPFELKAEKIEVAGASAPEYPLQKKRHSAEFLRTIAHLRPRTNLFSAVFRIRSQAAFAIHSFFQSRGFVYVHTPIITTSDCEGAGEMFRVTTFDFDRIPRDGDGAVDYAGDFFSRRASLTVSGQLNAEAFALAFADVYTFGPTFRAEASYTPRHAAEFWMVEPEIAFADLRDDMDLARDCLVYVTDNVMKTCPEEMEFLNTFVDSGLIARLTELVHAKFYQATYTEAVALLKQSGVDFAYPVRWGMNLQTEHERYLSETQFGGPVFVTDYPKEIKPFYMRFNDDDRTVAAMDLLVPGVGELIGGSQREERYDVLLDAIEKSGLKKEDYWWYTELRKYGGVAHAGFGLGFERLIMYLTGVQNIRDVLAFPRTAGSAEF